MEPARNAGTHKEADYLRHRPEQTLLHQLVERHYAEFERLMARHDCMDAGGRATHGAVAEGTPLPAYIAREFEDYLKCGRLEHGFLRVRCDCYHHEKLVAFSCKRRASAPAAGQGAWSRQRRPGWWTRYCLVSRCGNGC